MTRTWRVLTALAVLATDAAAAPRIAPRAEIGELATGGDAKSWLVTTAAADASYSFGRAQLVSDVAGGYRLALTWRRIDADALTLEIWLPDGAVVLVKDGGIALFRDNASFPGFTSHAVRTQASARIEVVQSVRTLELHIDGALAHQWPHPSSPVAGRIAVAVKAAPRRRARLHVTDLAIAHGQ